jgi:hypothetical protein
MTSRILIAGLLTCAGLAVPSAAPDAHPDGLVVHEWGTFLAMSGSDGVSLDGMYHEEHALPAFVHARSRDQLRLRSAVLKGETPVIYFYTDTPQRVRVRVGFPAGFWTQWYPQAEVVRPSLLAAGAPPRPRNGEIRWTVDVVPAATADARPPSTSRDALWNHAREVDAAYVRGVDHARPGSPPEWERFIFYRGLGEAPLPLGVHATDGRITIRAGQLEGAEHLYILRVENGRASYDYVRGLDPGAQLTREVPSLEAARPLDEFADRLADDLARRLVESGLYEKEARAMVNTWRGSYFRTEGIRVLFVLPQAWTDRYIPLQITPHPASLVRVMVGRVEVLTPEHERRSEGALRDLGSPDAQLRAEAFAQLRGEGRYVEPIVRRTLETSPDARVRALARRLLLTDFITELRTTVSDAARGDRIPEYPVYAQAQLASLLREVGLIDEARHEAAAALSRLERMPPPQMTNHTSRQLYRALARAHEGASNDAMALKWYGEFVQFGSQAARCGGCHALEGPQDPSFFRDWWAGRKFAEYAERTGAIETLIASHEKTLANNPRHAAAQLALAYLHERRGNRRRAGELWAAIDPGAR